jgi:ribosomal protein S18 acetylase RimI-like enzyme
MDITIEKGSLKYLYDCEDALRNSDLGKYYFTDEGSCKRAVSKGLEEGNLYVALADGVCAGFVWCVPGGMFHGFPYIHIISVKEAYRNKGIGKKLMDFIETLLFESRDKIFLIVANFNPNAKRFYERNGYVQVGEIPDLYKPEITEYLMMKKKES